MKNPNLSKVIEMQVDECPSRYQCQQQHRCGRILLFESKAPTDILQNTVTQTKPKPKDSAANNVSRVNKEWSEILFDKQTQDKPNKEEFKKTIMQMLKMEEINTRDDPTDEFIKINRQTFSSVEVQKVLDDLYRNRNKCKPNKLASQPKQEPEWLGQ